MHELAAIDKRYAGQGPVLVNEYEEYTKHFMRRARGSDPYEHWNAGRAQLRDPKLPVPAHAYDLDQMTPSYVELWPLIALRRWPAESRPPSNFDRVWSGRFYDVWRRVRPAPVTHVPLGMPPLDPTGLVDCRLVRKLAAGGRVVAALRPKPIVIPIGQTGALPPGWYRDAQNLLAIDAGYVVPVTSPFTGGGPLRIWLRGRAFRPAAARVDGQGG